MNAALHRQMGWGSSPEGSRLHPASSQGQARLGEAPPAPPLTRSSFAGVPSAPRSVISNVNETSLVLEWSEPRDTGGRDDLLYNVICKKCSVERRLCTRCDDNVEFVPRQLGLTERHIYISNLLAHTQYTFEVQAVNGVSSKSPYSPQFASVNITTNQAGQCTGSRQGMSLQQCGAPCWKSPLCPTAGLKRLHLIPWVNFSLHLKTCPWREEDQNSMQTNWRGGSWGMLQRC